MILFKFGQRQHLDPFRSAGRVYMSPQSDFAGLESDLVRGDRLEDTDQIHQPRNIAELRIDDLTLLPADLAGPVYVRLSESTPCNLFCTFAVIGAVVGPFVDERNFGFGDSFIILLDAGVFIDRMRRAASSVGFRTFSHGMVEYYDAQTYSGPTGPFRKSSAFAYQQEFRIAVEPGASKPVVLSLGSLADITSTIHPLSDVNRIVDLTNAWTKVPAAPAEVRRRSGR
jgi:hypothetical protein